MDSNLEKQIPAPGTEIPPPAMEQPMSAAPTYITTQPIAAHVDYAADSPRLLVGQALGPEPTFLTCRHCNQDVTTTVELRTSMKTHLIAGLCCLVGGVILAWIPYVVKKAKTKDHCCPNCEQFLGSGKEWPFIR